ncbi:MAG: hypothetical protein NPIRA06_13100 [Nitrospirales bacterium]|nr:MAG: hypothetical protein NPIRA06_13100 [Nitrospirales bacterium]
MHDAQSGVPKSEYAALKMSPGYGFSDRERPAIQERDEQRQMTGKLLPGLPNIFREK